MLISFKCQCGNNNTKKAKVYNGVLGYEAVICLKCGRYYDQAGAHEPETDKESVLYIKKGN